VPLEVGVIPAGELTSEQSERWTLIQEAEPTLANPFFRPEFTRIVAEVRDDAWVCVLTEAGEARGFFPFQRGRLPAGIPIGGGRSNYQGVIAERALEWDVPALLRGCGLRVYDFDHLILDQPQFARFHSAFDVSPVMDMTGGFDAYAERLRATGSKVVKKVRQQERRIEREIGALRFEPNVTDPAVLDSMMRWKSQQYLDTGSQDRFAERWNVELMQRIHAAQEPGFQGMLSALYAGDKLAAVSMSMRSHHVFHYWFPTYDRELASYSPGMVLLLGIAECAEQFGITSIDLGLGRAPYKDRLATGEITLAQGSARVPSLLGSARVAREAIGKTVRGSALRGPARAANRVVRRLTGRA
jgi:CelD/BcsL family acetyltransferase involved in cellulose biosynthesis